MHKNMHYLTLSSWLKEKKIIEVCNYEIIFFLNQLLTKIPFFTKVNIKRKSFTKSFFSGMKSSNVLDWNHCAGTKFTHRYKVTV